MKLAVIVRQVPDLIEPLEIDATETAVDYGAASFVLNESDDHALEQALLLKESCGGSLTVVALDFGSPDEALYAAAAKGADRLIRIGWQEDQYPSPRVAAGLYAAVLGPLAAELVLVGVSAHNELDGVLPPFLALSLGLPYVGVIRGVALSAAGDGVAVCKEFPGAVMARLQVKTPAVLGILGAEQPPRYVPVSRLRAAMKSATIEEVETPARESETLLAVRRLYTPTAGGRAEMMGGSVTEIADRIADLLSQRGLLK